MNLPLWQIVSTIIIALLGAGWLTQLVKNRGDKDSKELDIGEQIRRDLREDLRQSEEKHEKQLADMEARHKEEIAALKEDFGKKWEGVNKKLEAAELERDKFRKQVEDLDRKLWESNQIANAFADKVLFFLENQWDDRKAREKLAAEIGHSRRKTDRHSPMSSTHRILFVDDTEGTVEVMSLILTQAGYEVSKSLNGPDALQQWTAARATGKPFDLVILDYSMPQMNGEQVATKIRADELPGERVPIVLFTGAAEQISDEAKARLHADVWEKPIGAAELQTLTKEAIKTT